jgi:hypothetical protein
MNSAISVDLDQQISMTQERLVHAVTARLPTMPLETKERYFAVLSTLEAKLSEAEKPLRQVLQETVAEMAGVIMQELGARG